MTECDNCDNLKKSQCAEGRPINHLYGRGMISVASKFKNHVEVTCSIFRFVDRGISHDGGDRSRAASKKHRRNVRKIRASV